MRATRGRATGRRARLVQELRDAVRAHSTACFQRFMLGMIAAKKPRPARADRHPALQGLANGGPKLIAPGEPEIIVRGEVAAGGGDELTAPLCPLERDKLVVEPG